MAYTYEYPRPTVTTDIVLFAGNVDVYQSLQVLLIQRKNEPFQGMWAFPGGFVDMDEDLLTCALRELAEETGVKNVELVQLHTFGSVDRDPRHRTISVVYGGVIPNTLEAIAMDDADDARWFCLAELPKLAFDHQQILEFAKTMLLKNK